MNKRLLLVVAIPILLFCWLFWGLDTTSPEQDQVLQDQEMSIPTLNFESELSQAKDQLTDDAKMRVEQLDLAVQNSTDPENKITALKELSSFWSQQQMFYLAGTFAEQIAELEETSASWGIAGTTFLLGVQKEGEDQFRQKVMQARAIQSLENAISANPQEIDYRINLALAYVELPPPDQPMKGIQQLLELKDKYPLEPKVSAQLGRLALQTGQKEKAFERYLEANKLGLNSKEIVCLLAQLAQELEKDEAKQYAEECRLLISTNKE